MSKCFHSFDRSHISPLWPDQPQEVLGSPLRHADLQLSQ